MQQLEALAVSRKFHELDRWRPGSTSWTQQLKNPVGRWIDAILIPVFAKGVHMIWDAEDWRLTLLKQLKQTET
jgi:hypothetical protein